MSYNESLIRLDLPLVSLVYDRELNDINFSTNTCIWESRFTK